MTVRTGTLIMVLCAVLASPASAAGHGHRGCPAPHRKLLHRDPVAEVYYASNGAITGCVFSVGQPQKIGFEFEARSQGSHGISIPILAGDYVAYEQIRQPFEAEPGEPTSFYIVVRDLRTGKIVHSEPTGISSEPAEVGLNETSSLALSSTGAVAWIVIDRQTMCEPARGWYCAQVHVVTSRGAASIVAEGTVSAFGIEPNSLQLHQGMLSWEQDAERKRLTLR
jgi:hypothetical protein